MVQTLNLPLFQMLQSSQSRQNTSKSNFFLCLVVMGDDSCSKGRAFKSWCHILDGHLDIFYIDLLYKLYCLYEKTKNKQQRGRVVPFKKKVNFTKRAASKRAKF